MADGGDVVHVRDHAVVLGTEHLDDQVNRHLVVRALVLLGIGFAAGDLMDDEGITNGDTLDHPLGDDLFALPVVELIFNGRASAVQGKDIHLPYLLYFRLNFSPE